MTELEAEAHWSEQTKTLCRIYQSLHPALADLPSGDLIELSRKIATNLVFTMAEVKDPDANVEDALTSISAICQSCTFERTVLESSS